MDARISPPLTTPKKRGRRPRDGTAHDGAAPEYTPRCRDLVPLGDRSGSARFFRKMVKDVESDLGGRRFLSRIEAELIRAFCGAATMLQYQNVQLALGETSEIDPTAYATLASTMLRIGSRLGLRRRSKDVSPTLDDYLDAQSAEDSEEVVS
jgi:hypothetical protein